MNLTKKHWAMLIIGVLALIAVWYFFLRKKKGAESSYDPSLLIMGGESGYKTFKPNVVDVETTNPLYKPASKCSCGSGTGICYKDGDTLRCAPAFRRPNNPAANERMSGGTASGPQCPAGTKLKTCYEPDGKSFPCCIESNA